MEETGTDLIEVVDVPGEVDGEAGLKQGEEIDLSAKTLTKKMIFLLEKISEYGYLSLPEVQMIYANQSHAYKVLKTLKEKGLAGEFPTEELPQKAYYLRPTGYRILEKFERLRHKRRFVPSHYKRFIFNHRLACAQVGLVLEKHPLVRNFMPEVLLWDHRKSERDKMCDGEFWYKVPQEEPQRVGLEVELTLKNREKLDESLQGLNDRRDLAQVWWVCADDTILRALKREVLARPWIKPQRHLFCLMKDFLALKQKVCLYNPQGEEFTIDPTGPTVPVKPEAPPIPQPTFQPPARAEATPQPQPAMERNHFEELRAYEEKCRRREEEREAERRRTKRPATPYFLWGFLTLLIGISGFFIASTAIQIIRASFPETPPPKPWFVRKIINEQDVNTLRGTWTVQRLALRSRGDKYRLSLKLLNPGGFWCGLMGVKALDADHQTLAELNINGGEWIFAHHSWEDSLVFKAPRTATRFFVDIASDGWDCFGMEIPVDFR